MNWLPLFLLNIIVACGGRSAPEANEPVMSPVVEPTTEAAPVERRASVVWSEAAGTARCFFFSGPPVAGAEVRDVHGANATLREEAGTTSLDFGEGVVFRGPTDQGRLVRQESYDYQGKWEITETITFDVVGDGPWRGRYAYEECELDTGRACPGRCRIDAVVVAE